MMEAVRTSETSVDNHFTRQYIPEDNSEHDSYLLVFFYISILEPRKMSYYIQLAYTIYDLDTDTSL
jgi:hypothetical protein